MGQPDVHIDLDATWARFAGDYVIPTSYRITFDDPDRFKVVLELQVRVREGERPELAELRCVQRADGPPVSSGMLRELPLGSLVRESARLAAHRLDHVWDGGWVGTPLWSEPTKTQKDAMQQVFAEYRNASLTRKPGRRVPDDLLHRVADIYRRALTDGRPPTRAVEIELHCSRATAGRWVAQARGRDYLGAAVKKGKAGEQPTRKRKEK